MLYGKFEIPINTELTFIPNSFIYASYNIIPLIPLILTLKNEFNTIEKINKITIASFLTISVCAIAVFIITCSTNIDNSEIILLQLAKNWNIRENIMFSFVILSAIYTSAVCSGYSFVKNITKNEKQYRLAILIICLISIPISTLNFSNTLQIIYPAFGILGLLQIYYLIKSN